MSEFILLRDVAKSFSNPANRVVIENLSLAINPGMVVAICGRSGVGKTTLLRLIAGLEQPDHGTVTIDGVPPAKMYPRLGWVNQDYARSLFPWLSAKSNVALALLSSKKPKKQRLLDAEHWLGETGLAESMHLRPWQLSGGMQQRVAISRALANYPLVLCLDEPFASLDSNTREDLQDLILDLTSKYGITVIIVTHDIEEAIYMSDLIVVLEHEGAASIQIDVPLQRPRNQINSKSDPLFVELKTKLRNLIAGK
jgi:NitT/TauT family transport system ATP-binding protein